MNTTFSPSETGLTKANTYYYDLSNEKKFYQSPSSFQLEDTSFINLNGSMTQLDSGDGDYFSNNNILYVGLYNSYPTFIQNFGDQVHVWVLHPELLNPLPEVPSAYSELRNNLEAVSYVLPTITAISTNQTKSVIELYSAYFNRGADSSGLDFWESSFISRLSENITEIKALELIASEMSNSAEYQALYPSTLSIQEMLIRVYNNILNRAPDDEGLAFWSNHINTGSFAAAQAIIQIITAAKLNTTPQGLIDATYIANKTTVSEYLALKLQSNDLVLIANAFNNITDDAESVNNTINSLNKILTKNAIAVNIDGSVTGKIDSSSDQDWFKVDLVADKSYLFTLTSTEVDAITLTLKQSSNLVVFVDEPLEMTKTGFKFDNEVKSIIGVTPSTSSAYYLGVDTPNNINIDTEKNYKVKVELLIEATDDYKDNIDTRGKINVSNTVFGKTEIPFDSDWYQTDLVAGTSYSFTANNIISNNHTSALFNLTLYSEKGDYIGNHLLKEEDSNYDSLDTNVKFTAPEDGKYYVGLQSSNTGVYSLNIEVTGLIETPSETIL
jgi:hypothetical protein